MIAVWGPMRQVERESCGELGHRKTGSSPPLRLRRFSNIAWPEGPTCNSHARKGVVAIALINHEARRAGTLCHAMSSIIALCRTFGAHSS
jgi:hypothetical protein